MNNTVFYKLTFFCSCILVALYFSTKTTNVFNIPFIITKKPSVNTETDIQMRKTPVSVSDHLKSSQPSSVLRPFRNKGSDSIRTTPSHQSDTSYLKPLNTLRKNNMVADRNVTEIPSHITTGRSGTDVLTDTRKQSGRYLFPLIFYGCGPCEQYSFFVSGIINAITQNRSIVTIPFHNNHLQNANIKRSLNETFNYSKLREIVGLITVDEFIDVCGTNFTAENILLGPGGYPDKNNLREKALDSYQVDVIKTKNYIPNFNLPTRNEVKKYQDNLSGNTLQISNNVKCVFFLTSMRFYAEYNGEKYKDIMAKIGTNLVRASYIQKMADDVIKQISDGSQYAVIHWRNKTAEYCSRTLSPSQYARFCKSGLQEEIRKLTAVSGQIANAIAKSVSKKNITKLYMATPEFEHALINDMKKIFPGTKSASDIILESKYKNDNYVYSLVDQEIAQRADYFISSHRSVWSYFVVFFREQSNKTSVKLWDLPGYPKSVSMSLQHMMK